MENNCPFYLYKYCTVSTNPSLFEPADLANCNFKAKTSFEMSESQSFSPRFYSLTGPDAGSQDVQAALREQAPEEPTPGRAKGDTIARGGEDGFSNE